MLPLRTCAWASDFFSAAIGERQVFPLCFSATGLWVKAAFRDGQELASCHDTVLEGIYGSNSHEFGEPIG